jgi:hypothetical protein
MTQLTSTSGLWLKLPSGVKTRVGIQLKKKYLCLKLFGKSNGNMVRTCHKHDAFILKSEDYVINIEDHELPTVTIIDVSPLLMRRSQPILLEI